MGFLNRVFGREREEKDRSVDEQSRFDMSQLAALFDERLEKTQSQALEKTRSAVKEIIREKAASQDIVEQIKEIDFDDEIKDRTYKPIITSKPVYVRGMLEGLKGIRDVAPKDFEELAAFYDRVARSLKTIQTVQHKKGRYMSFAFQKETLSLGSHLNNILDAAARLEEELSRVSAVSEENEEILVEIDRLKSEIRRIDEGAKKTAGKAQRLKELEDEIIFLEQEIKGQKDSAEYKKHLEIEEGLELAERSLGELDSRVNSLVSPLKRPFRKYEKLLESSGAKRDKELLKKIREYQKSPKQAFATEEQGDTVLEAILTGLKEMITKGDLPLSERERKKTLHRIGQLEGGVIAGLQRQRASFLKEVSKAKTRLTESEVMGLIEERETRFESLRKQRDEMSVADGQDPLAEITVDDLKVTIEVKASKLLGRTVELEISESGGGDGGQDL